MSGRSYPIVSDDEVMYASPAVNLYYENVFYSTAWNKQGRHELWAGNVPLYQFVLSAWLQVFGFDPLSVRSLNYTFMVLSGVFFWIFFYRMNLMRASLWRLVPVLMILMDYGITRSYRVGKPEALNVLLVSIILWITSFPKRSLRKGLGLFFLGCLLPWASLQVCLFVGFISITALVFFVFKRYFYECLYVLSGMVVGVILLYALYSYYGVWNTFLASTLGSHSALGEMTAWRKLSSLRINGGGLFKDPTLWFLLFLAGVVVYYLKRKKIFNFHSPLAFGLFSSTCIPLVIFWIGKYPIFYTWMAVIPLSITLCMTLDSQEMRDFVKFFRGFLLVAIISSFAAGLPMFTFFAVLNWQKLDYKNIEELVKGHVSPEDWVICDPGAYYAVRTTTNNLFLRTYAERLTPEEKDKISVLVVSPNSAEALMKNIGGLWNIVENTARPRYKDVLFKMRGTMIFESYSLNVYVRDPSDRVLFITADQEFGIE